MVRRYYVGSVSLNGFLELCYDDKETLETRNYKLQSPDLKDDRDTFVLASDYDALALAVYDECSRQGCFCPTDPATGECSFCKLSLALNGYVPAKDSKHG